MSRPHIAACFGVVLFLVLSGFAAERSDAEDDPIALLERHDIARGRWREIVQARVACGRWRTVEMIPCKLAVTGVAQPAVVHPLKSAFSP